jgi:D-glycero-D-manno-heptose 1,7-bisphosphate phosphatase
MKKNTAVFLDRDGTINEEVGYMDNLDKFKVIPCAYEAIRLINESGMKVVVISNQSGIARGLLSEELVKKTHYYLQTILRQQGAYVDNFYYCPHHPTTGTEPYRQICNCRKPAPGMLLQAAQDLDIDLTKSYIVGDRYNDMEAGRKIGVRGILVKTGFGQSVLHGDGPDKATPQNKPDFIAEDILEAVKWILSQVASFG